MMRMKRDEERRVNSQVRSETLGDASVNVRVYNCRLLLYMSVCESGKYAAVFSGPVIEKGSPNLRERERERERERVGFLRCFLTVLCGKREKTGLSLLKLLTPYFFNGKSQLK